MQILVDTVVLSNVERYSSQVESFLLLGSHEFPVSEWTLLGEFTAENVYGEQEFKILKPAWVRYVKLR